MTKEQSLDNLLQAARKLAKCPNVESRISDWRDVDEATKEVIAAIKRIDSIDWKCGIEYNAKREDHR